MLGGRKHFAHKTNGIVQEIGGRKKVFVRGTGRVVREYVWQRLSGKCAPVYKDSYFDCHHSTLADQNV